MIGGYVSPKNTRALQQGERAQAVVSGVVTNNALSCGLPSVRKQSRVTQEAIVEETEERDEGILLKTKEYDTRIMFASFPPWEGRNRGCPFFHIGCRVRETGY